MVSAFQSRKFGFVLPLNKNELMKVNEKRNGEKYVDGEAAILKRGTADKQPLTLSPLYVKFEYGPIRRAIGLMNTLSCIAKTCPTASLYCTPRTRSTCVWTTRADTTGNTKMA